MSQLVVIALSWNSDKNLWEATTPIDCDRYEFFSLVINKNGNFLILKSVEI